MLSHVLTVMSAPGNMRDRRATDLNTVEQENFATGNFRDFRPQAIRVQEIFANFTERHSRAGKIRVQEIFANLTIFAKFPAREY